MAMVVAVHMASVFSVAASAAELGCTTDQDEHYLSVYGTAGVSAAVWYLFHSIVTI
jgi:hypothetical protein